MGEEDPIELNLGPDQRTKCRETADEAIAENVGSPMIRAWSNTIILLLDDVDKLINHIRDYNE